eukprot:7823520-Pyramimonas_sp.AAC.1
MGGRPSKRCAEIGSMEELRFPDVFPGPWGFCLRGACRSSPPVWGPLRSKVKAGGAGFSST